MSETINNFPWLQKSTPEERLWCINYLAKRQVHVPSQHPQTNSCITKDCLQYKLEELNTTAEGREIVRKMRGAWSQNKFRNKRGKRSYSFVMSTSIQTQLSYLSEQIETPLGETLELIISGLYEETSQRIKLEKENSKKQKKLKQQKLKDHI